MLVSVSYKRIKVGVVAVVVVVFLGVACVAFKKQFLLSCKRR